MTPGFANMSFRTFAKRRAAGFSPRGAFTLTEMLVALAVTVVALAVVTNVFSVTTKTAATSAAIADVESLVRNLAHQLQQDLEHCDPSQSILVIHGRTQPAALSEDLRQAGQYYRVLTGDPGLVPAGYDTRFDTDGPGGSVARDQFSDPRADILMFFTARASASKAPATDPLNPLNPNPTVRFQARLQQGAKVSPIQVVYGHAAFDTAVSTGGDTWAFADNPQHIEYVDANGLSVLPAKRWHLARRQVLFDSFLGAPFNGFRSAAYPRVWRCYSDPSSQSRLAADAVQFDFTGFLQQFQPLPPMDARPRVAALSPYGFSPGSFVSPMLRWPGEAEWFRDCLLSTLYPNRDETDHHVATVIEHPPAALQDNLGLHLVPGCVWFQVEFLMPEDPRNGFDHPLSDQRRDTPRWVSVENGQTYVFVPDSEENRQLVESQIVGMPPTPDMPVGGSRLSTFARVIPMNADIPTVNYGGRDSVENRRVRMWPYAIRVTVRVFDQRERLENPIVRSVVHRFD